MDAPVHIFLCAGLMFLQDRFLQVRLLGPREHVEHCETVRAPSRDGAIYASVRVDEVFISL